MSLSRFSPQEIVETIRMVQMENLDIRTITMGISLRDCSHPDLETAGRKAYDKICRLAGGLVRAGEEIAAEYGIPVINKRISVTPVALVAESADAASYAAFAGHLDRANQVARTVTTKVRYPDFSIRSRSSTAAVGFADAERIGELACALLDRALADRPGPLRLVGVSVSNLESHEQLVLG